MAMVDFGSALDDHGFQKQIKWLQKELLVNEKKYGPDHKKVAVTLANLGSAYGNIGDYQKQTELLKRLLVIKEKQYGPDHKEVAIILNNLGIAYRNTGDYQKQKDLLERSLLIMEKHYGPDHKEVAIILMNLGNAYGTVGAYQKQRELLERSLLIVEKHYGPDHIQVAVTLAQLGNAYGNTGDHQKQKELLERSLVIVEKHHGPDHIQVAVTLAQLGNAYGNIGDYQKQKGLLERVLAIIEKHHGPDHKEVAIILNNLGIAYRNTGDYQKQKDLLERSLLIMEKHYGPDHKEVAIILMNLGNAYGTIGAYQKQRELLERCILIVENHYGPDHIQVAVTLANLGNAYGNIGDHQKQKELLERSLLIVEKHHGPDHIQVAVTLAQLGNAYGNIGDHQKQKELLERSLVILEKHHGPDHIQVAVTLAQLGNAYGNTGDHQKQKELLERVLAINERHRGSEYVDVEASIHLLGRLSVHQALKWLSPGKLDLDLTKIARESVKQPQPIGGSTSLAVKTPAGSRLQLLRQIGSGRYGFVLEVVDESGFHSALKMIPVISSESEHVSGTSKSLHDLEYVHHLSTFELQDEINVERPSDENCASTQIISEAEFTNVTTNQKETSSNSADKILITNDINNKEQSWIIEAAGSADLLPSMRGESEYESDQNNTEEAVYEHKQARREAWFNVHNIGKQCPNIVCSICSWVAEDMSKREFSEYKQKINKKLNVKNEDAASLRITQNANEDSKITVFLLQMQFYPMGNLERWLEGNNAKFSETYGHRVHILRGILVGLEFLHGHKVMHRDLSPLNILLEECNETITAKICDFGTAMSFGLHLDECDMRLTKTRDAHTCGLGTDPYWAPEIHDKYDHRCDIYSFGMIVLKTMWNVKTIQELLRMRYWLDGNQTGKFENNSKFLPNAKNWLEFIKSLMARDYETRPSCKTLLQNKLFSEESDSIK